MNAMGDWRYVTDKDIATFGGLEKRREALTPSGWLGRIWLTKLVFTQRRARDENEREREGRAD